MNSPRIKKQGLAAVELALMLPVLALMVVLLAEGANAMHTYSSMIQASREGARHVLVQGTNADVDSLVAALVGNLDAENLKTTVTMDPVANTVTVAVAYDYSVFGQANGNPFFGGNNNENLFQFIAQTTMPMP